MYTYCSRRLGTKTESVIEGEKVMKNFSNIQRAFSCFCIVALLGLQSLSASAAIVNTGSLIHSAQPDESRVVIDKEAVQKELIAMGVDPEVASERISQLSNEELLQMADLDELPTGAGAGGVVVTVFLVLIITDLLGVTDVFPFVKKASR